MPYDRQLQLSPSKIPRFSPTPAAVAPRARSAGATQDSGSSEDIVRQLLDEIITSVVLQFPESDSPNSKHELLSAAAKASSARRSAITALKEGIDVRCDEACSIEAMEEALDSTVDSPLLSLSPPSPPRQRGTTLQELGDLSCSTEFAAESLEVDGPADSWLRASADLASSASAQPRAKDATPRRSLQIRMHGPSWEDYVQGMDHQRVHTRSTTALSPAVCSASSQQPARPAAAASRSSAAKATADKVAGALPAPTRGGVRSPSSPTSSKRSNAPLGLSRTPSSPSSSAAAGSRSRGAAVVSSPHSRPNSFVKPHNAPRSPTARSSPPGSPKAGAAALRSPGVVVVAASPRSPGSAATLPAPLRSSASPRQQQQQLRYARTPTPTSSSSAAAAVPRQPVQQLPQQPALRASQESISGINSNAAGLDVVLVGSCRRSSSDNGSSRRGSVQGGGSLGGGVVVSRGVVGAGGGSGQLDEATATWMTSLRSAAPSSSGGSRKYSRSQSASTTGTPPLSSRSSGRLLYSSRSARSPIMSVGDASAPAEATTPPPAALRSARSSSSRSTPRSTTPRSATPRSLPVADSVGAAGGCSSSSSKHAHLSLRPARSGGASRPASVSPRTAAARGAEGHTLSPPGAAAAAAGRAGGGGGMPAAAAAACSNGVKSACAAMHSPRAWLSAGDVVGAADGCRSTTAAGMPSSTGGASELLLSDHEIMADPTAVLLFMELNEEIQADCRAAMACAAAAAHEAVAASSRAMSGRTAAVEPSGGKQSSGGGQGLVGESIEVLPLPPPPPPAAAAPTQLLLQQQQLTEGGQDGPRDYEASRGSLDKQQLEPCMGSSAQPKMSSAGAATAPTVAVTEVPTALPAAKSAAVSERSEAAAHNTKPATAATQPTSPGRDAVMIGHTVDVTAADSHSGEEEAGAEQQPACGCRCVIM